MLCFPHLQLYEKGEEEKNEVVLPLARNGEAKTRRTSLSIFNSPIFPTALYIDKDVKYWKSILAYGLHWCVVFSIFHSQITLQYMMQCLCFSFNYVRKKRESTTSYIFVNIESFVIYVNDPGFPQKGNIPASANLCHRPADSSMNKKMMTYWRCFGDVASKDEWVRDVCHFRRVSKTDSMPRPPPSNSPLLIRPK